MKYLNSSVLKVGESASQRDNQFARHDNRLNYFNSGLEYEKCHTLKPRYNKPQYSEFCDIVNKI